MVWLNWLLGLTAAALWIGVFTWYFWYAIEKWWRERKDYRW